MPTVETVLITGARAPIALELARSFKAAGHIVIMADCLKLTIARWSKSVRKYYHIASPRFEINQFIADIQSIITNEKITHFIPTCEEAIYVSKYSDQFPCKVWTSPFSVIEALHHKFTFTTFKTAQFPIPETKLVSEFDDWENSEKYVFKPCFSRFASSVIINRKINDGFFNESEKTNWIAQKKIVGQEICVYSIWDNGVLKAFSAYHPLFRAGKGAGVFFEPINNELVYNCVKQFGKTINYTGQMSFDLILDDSNTPNFIECNPRGTSGAHLLNLKLAQAFLGDTLIVNDSNQEYSIKQIMLMYHFPALFSMRLRKSKDILFQKDDMKPFFLQPISLFEIAYIKFKKGISLLSATTENIEWNGNEN